MVASITACLSHLHSLVHWRNKPWTHITNKYNVLCICFIRGLQKEELVLLTHGDSVDKVADGFKVVAQSGNIIAGEQHA